MADRQVSVSRIIDAPASVIFAVLTDPARHGEIDGSGMVRRSRGESGRLGPGSRFGMDMRFGLLPYRITNTVVEYEPDRLIAWRHLGKHRWRYELEPAGDGATKVTETFDYSTAVSPAAIELLGYPNRHRGNIAATLERLAAAVERREQQP